MVAVCEKRTPIIEQTPAGNHSAQDHPRFSITYVENAMFLVRNNASNDEDDDTCFLVVICDSSWH